MTKQQPLPFKEADTPLEAPDLSYEEMLDFDDMLEEYLKHCRDTFLLRVEDGTWPWPNDVALDSDADLEEINY